MTEKKFNKKTLPESIKIHNTIKDKVSSVEAEDCLGAIKTFDETEKTCVQCKEVIQTYYNDTYEQITLYPDGNGGNVSVNGTIIQPPQPIGYTLKPCKLLQFARNHVKVSLEVEQGYEYLLDVLSAELHIDHAKVSSHHAAGTLHSDLRFYIDDAPIQLQIGVAHVKKGVNKGDS